MSMLIIPIVAALLGAPQEPVVVQAEPSGSAERTEGDAFMDQVWRRYHRIVAASITVTGNRTWADGRIDPIRNRSMIAPSGEVKLIGTSHNLTFKAGIAYSDSPYYAGMQVRVPADARPDAAVEALDDAWPLDPVPLAIRLRLGGSPTSGFDTLLRYAGNDPRLDVQAGVWSDGMACEVLRIRSADGGTDLALWVDQLTGFVRGLRGSIRPMGDRPASTIEALFETIESDKSPMIAVANRGVRPFDSFESMVDAWNQKYAVPPALPLAD